MEEKIPFSIHRCQDPLIDWLGVDYDYLAISVFPIIFLVTFFVTFGMGPATVPWTLLGELVPPKV